MEISRTATILAVCMSLCACGESDDGDAQDGGSMGSPEDGGQTRRDGGGQSEKDAATGPQTDAAQKPQEDAGDSPEDGGTPAEDAGTPDAGGPAATTFTRVYEIISQNCSPCHTTGTSGNLDMSSKANAYSELVGKPAEGPMCTGDGTRVIAGDPDDSLLIKKLRPDPVCGARMPRMRDPLADALINEIADWIQAGANND